MFLGTNCVTDGIAMIFFLIWEHNIFFFLEKLEWKNVLMKEDMTPKNT